MLSLRLSSAFLLLSTLVAGNVVPRQDSLTDAPNPETMQVLPTGVQDSNGNLTTEIPLACAAGCFPIVGLYS